MTAAVALRVAGLRVRYPGVRALALDGVDFEVCAGETHALIGHNGAGKSTLLHVLAGAIAPTGGVVSLRGAPFQPRDPADARRRGIALIHQELALAPHLSVEANIVLGAEPVRRGFLDRRRAQMLARAALNTLGRADVPLDARVSQLSAASRQLVEIARALACGADVLLLDEPTSSLSRHEVAPLFAVLERLRADGKALVYISHVLSEVRAVATRGTVLRDGRVAAHGSLATLSDAQIVDAMVGRALASLVPRARPPGEVVLRVEGLRCRGIDDASFELRRGEVLGIAGLVGSGRTELLRAVFGLEPMQRGTCVGKGFAANDRVCARWRAGVGLVSEDRKHEGLALRATIADNVVLPALGRLARGPFLVQHRVDDAARAMIDRFAIHCDSPAQVACTLSGGNQQKVALARLLHAGCDVWLLDEPTRGIDVGARAEVYALLASLVAGTGAAPPAAVLLVSSELTELLTLCDRVAVLRRGRLAPAQPARGFDSASLLRAMMGDDNAQVSAP